MAADTFAPPHFTLPHPSVDLPKNARVVVVGAGAFGGWSALYLLRQGYRVTLIDAWGAGNSRSSSGDETRVIRSTYGANEFYFDLNVRALALWQEEQKRWNKNLFYNTGVLWLCYQERTPLVDDSIPFARKHKMEYEFLNLKSLSQRFPHINLTDIHHAFLDPFGGYLKAHESMQSVQEAFAAEGGHYENGYVEPKVKANELCFELEGEPLKADFFLFACGPWLGRLFPDVLGNIITCTKQEAYYFGVPRDVVHLFDKMPAWVDVDGTDYYYGIPGNANRGFKIGVDQRGEPFDPTNGERILNPETLAKARQFIEHRFPALKNAPLLESRVCPYENSLDGNFIFRAHPASERVWLLGGGSGHGFKHGPALGEWVANCIAGKDPRKLIEAAQR